MSAAAPAALPPLLAANPRLDQWVGFDDARPGHGFDRPGRDRPRGLDRDAADRRRGTRGRRSIASCCRSGDTDLTPNEGYTAGSQSIQFGGVALRLACAEVRGLFLDHAAAAFGCPRAELSVRDGAIIQTRRADRPRLLVARSRGRSSPPRRGATHRSRMRMNIRSSGGARRASISPARCSARPSLCTIMVLDGMVHARVVRQPRRGAMIKPVDEAALRRAAKAPIEIVRNGNFLAIIGADETVVEAVAAVAPNHVVWDGVEPINPFQEEARWLLQQPSIDRVVGAPPPAAPTAGSHPLRGDLHPDAHRPRLGGAVLRAPQSTATGGSRCGRIRRASTRCATRWRAP